MTTQDIYILNEGLRQALNAPVPCVPDSFHARARQIVDALAAEVTATAHDDSAAKCTVCRECIECNLRPCRNGGEHTFP